MMLPITGFKKEEENDGELSSPLVNLWKIQNLADDENMSKLEFLFDLCIVLIKSNKNVFMPRDKYSIKNLLNSNLKDTISPEKKAGIYQINCKDSENVYGKKNMHWIINQSY